MNKLTGLEPCMCGHAVEEHGGIMLYPGSRACSECDCIHYEADIDNEEEDK